MANPLSEYRWSQVRYQTVDLDSLKNMCESNIVENDDRTKEDSNIRGEKSKEGAVFDIVDDLMDSLQKVEIEDQQKLVCNLCNATYTSSGYLKVHMDSKHGIQTQYSCSSCEKQFNSEQSLKRHGSKFCEKL